MLWNQITSWINNHSSSTSTSWTSSWYQGKVVREGVNLAIITTLSKTKVPVYQDEVNIESSISLVVCSWFEFAGATKNVMSWNTAALSQYKEQSWFISELPKVHLEFGKKSFHYQGAKICNELPIEFRSITSRFILSKSLSEHFY